MEVNIKELEPLIVLSVAVFLSWEAGVQYTTQKEAQDIDNPEPCPYELGSRRYWWWYAGRASVL
jgi:hypothetical protein